MEIELDICLRQLPEFIYDNNLRYKSHKKYDIDELRKEIIEIIYDKDNPPPSLAKVARSFGYKNSRTLKTKLPNECNIIIKNYKNYMSENKKEKKKAISEAVTHLLENGVYPSQKSVERKLGKTSYFWNHSNRVLLNEICKEKGVVRKKGPHTKIEIK